MSGLDDIGKKLFGTNSLSELASQVADGFFGDAGNLKDYSHASKLMRPNGLALAPKQKFLFHVFFNLQNPEILKNPTDRGIVGALVKSAQLPSFKLDTDEYIQYNRKRLVHNRIKYDPITIKLHDDGQGNVLDMWQNYYQYYFNDSTYTYTEGIPNNNGANGRVDYNDRDLYAAERIFQKAGWGRTVASPRTNGTKPAFFKDIKIYGFNRGGYVLYTLINPVITAWDHDTYDYADSTGIMEHSVTLQYEAVKYYDSSAIDDTVAGFGEASRYDTEPGALGPGSTASLFGQGGLTDTFGAVMSDLSSGNLAGAVQKAGASARTFGSADNLVNVVTGDGIGAVRGEFLKAIESPPRLSDYFPSPNDSTTPNQAVAPKKAEE
jgi:hypothetical protein